MSGKMWVGKGRARAFLYSSPVTAPAFFLPLSGKDVAGHFRRPMSGTDRSASLSIADDVSQIPVHDDHFYGDPQSSWDDYIEA